MMVLLKCKCGYDIKLDNNFFTADDTFKVPPFDCPQCRCRFDESLVHELKELLNRNSASAYKAYVLPDSAVVETKVTLNL